MRPYHFFAVVLFFVVILVPFSVRSNSNGLTNGPLRVSSANPRYFEDRNGKAILVTGSHTWGSMQDVGPSDPPVPWNYAAYLDFLQRYNHNFFRLWIWEQARYSEMGPEWFSPTIYERTGPGNALDGKPKFDLNRFNPVFFDRLNSRVRDAQQRGIYVAIVLFDGWSVDPQKTANVWRGHPLNSANNINNINGDPNNDGNGSESHELAVPAITELQKAYIRRVIDTVNQYDNVLYEISNESHAGSKEWQYELIRYIKQYQQSKPNQHVVGMTVAYPNGSNDDLYNSPADWISPNGSINDAMFNPPVADGRKVVVADTDHFCGLCEQADDFWVWRSFTRGQHPILMDVYQQEGYTIPDTRWYSYDWESVRRNMGYARRYAERMDLKNMVPRRTDVCSTDFCLVSNGGANRELLVFAPTGGSFNVNLSGMSGQFDVEWFSPETGNTTTGSPVSGGGNRSFSTPFGGKSVLYLKSGSSLQGPTNTPIPPTNTPRPAATNTPIPPTNTPRPAATNTPIPPTNTLVPTNVPITNPPGTVGGLRGEYFSGQALSGTPFTNRVDGPIDFTWDSAPSTNATADNFSVRWRGHVYAPVSGSYTFRTRSDDGVRLWVNNQQVINNWTDHGATIDTAPAMNLTAGQWYPITLEFYEGGGAATIALFWTYPGRTDEPVPGQYLAAPNQTLPTATNVPPTNVPPTNVPPTNVPPTATTIPTNVPPMGNGLLGSYYNNMTLQGNPVAQRVDGPINAKWTVPVPAGVSNEIFSVRWTGSVRAPVSGQYTFETLSDDGVRLWVNNLKMVENWTNHGPTYDTSAPIFLEAGRQYPITLEFFQNNGGSTIELRWSHPGQAMDTVPANMLMPQTGTPVATNTPVPLATNTPVPTATRQPTATSVPPTATSVPPTATSVPPTSQPGLPAPWASRDIGAVQLAGSASVTNGVFTARGSGSDIWGSSDQFRFVYMPWNGDGTITARVQSLQGTNSWAKAGVMFRETLDPGSRHAMMIVSPYAGSSFQRRTTTNGNSVDTPGTMVAAPYWVRLTRSGNTFTAYQSSDGSTWRTVGQETISMPSAVFIGLPVTSHDNSLLTTATFSNVTITGGAVAPTATTVPPTATTVPPTATTVPPTATPAPATAGLRGQYFNGKNVSGSPVLTVIEGPINYTWTGSPRPGVPSQNYSVRWTGYVWAPVSGIYRFRTRSDDGVRLWVNNQLLVNNWTDHSPTTNTSPNLDLTGGRWYPITLEFYENAGGATISLSWTFPNKAWEIVPGTALTP
jgi:regulation of enolase protein 1 (concanavalin A-like superfamily)